MLQELLESKKMTLYKLSKNSGVPYTTVNDIYHGRTSVSVKRSFSPYTLPVH